jgi:hypothetical protein
MGLGERLLAGKKATESKVETQGNTSEALG